MILECLYHLHERLALPTSVTYIDCNASTSGAMHGQQLRQLVETLVTLAVMFWQLARRIVSAYHPISRHSGNMWGYSRHELKCCLRVGEQDKNGFLSIIPQGDGTMSQILVCNRGDVMPLRIVGNSKNLH